MQVHSQGAQSKRVMLLQLLLLLCEKSNQENLTEIEENAYKKAGNLFPSLHFLSACQQFQKI